MILYNLERETFEKKKVSQENREGEKDFLRFLSGIITLRQLKKWQVVPFL